MSEKWAFFQVYPRLSGVLCKSNNCQANLRSVFAELHNFFWWAKLVHQKIYMTKNLSDFMIIALICAGNVDSYYENIYIIGRAVISQRP